MIDFNQLSGKTIVITGASRGIGRAVAQLLSCYPINLVVGSRSEEKLKLLNTGNACNFLPSFLDVTDEESVQQFSRDVLQKYGKVDILINCAGVGYFASFLESTTEEFDQMITVNLRGTYLCCKYLSPSMVAGGKGHILNLVSIAGTTALPGCAGYSASKFGVLGLTRVIQAELRKKGVQVTAVLPGAVNSSFWDHMESTPDLSRAIPVAALAKHIVYLLCQPEGLYVDEISIMPPLGIL